MPMAKRKKPNQIPARLRNNDQGHAAFFVIDSPCVYSYILATLTGVARFLCIQVSACDQEQAFFEATLELENASTDRSQVG